MSNKSKILAVGAFKGGIGKTSITALLGHRLAVHSNRRVLLVDLCNQRDLSEIFPASDSDGSADGSDAAYSSRFEGLDVLASSYLTEEDLLKAAAEYDLVIIDFPLNNLHMHETIFRVATHAVLPFVPEEGSIMGLRSMIHHINQPRLSDPIEIVAALPNQARIQTRLHRKNLEMLREDPLVAPHLADFVIGRRTIFVRALLDGRTSESAWRLGRDRRARDEVDRLHRLVEEKIF